MKYLPRFVCLAVWVLPLAARADLPADVNRVLADKQLAKCIVGVEIIRLGDTPAADQTLFRREAQTPLIPASNLKLLTTAAALAKLGPDFKFRTTLLLGDAGDVAIVGAGDPTFGDAEFLKNVGWSATTVLENWADQLARRGITSVRDVVVDDSVFDEQFVHPNWPDNQMDKHYQAQVGGFNFNRNLLEVDVRPTGAGQIATYTTTPRDTRYVSIKNTCVTGNVSRIKLARWPGTNDIVLGGQTVSRSVVPVSVTINDPGMYGVTVFSEVLRRKGIAVTGGIRRDRAISSERQPGRWKVVAIHETPLAMVLARANKDSVNLYAESLCKRLGRETSGQPGSWQNGPAALGAFLESLGVAKSEYSLDDGCGLSKRNAISAEAMAKILIHSYHSPSRDLFRATLAIAGQDGTLSNRFRGSDLRGRVFAKSGYVNGVCSLSGYLQARDGNWFVFSIIMNRAPGLAGMQQIQEKIIKVIDSNAPTLADSR